MQIYTLFLKKVCSLKFCLNILSKCVTFNVLTLYLVCIFRQSSPKSTTKQGKIFSLSGYDLSAKYMYTWKQRKQCAYFLLEWSIWNERDRYGRMHKCSSGENIFFFEENFIETKVVFSCFVETPLYAYQTILFFENKQKQNRYIIGLV